MRGNTCDVLLLGFEGQENLGLRSVAAYLIREGVRVRIEPLQERTRDEILARVRCLAPRIVGFSLIFQRMLDDFTRLIGYLREHGVDCHFTIGGHYPTFEYRQMLESIPGLDTVVRHEGEETLLELYRSLDEPGSWPQIKGLAFRRKGEVRATPERPLIADLDNLPFPLREPEGATHRGIGIRSIAGSRGCHYDCTFCSIHEFYRRSPGPRRRSRSPESLVREMKTLYDCGVRIFIMQDDDMSMQSAQNRQWVGRFLEELEANCLHDKIIWRVSCRIDDVDERLMRRMQVAGLVGVYLGIESGTASGLETFGKRYQVGDVLSSLETLSRIGLPFEFGFMLFEPYSTVESVRENISFLRTINMLGDALVHFCKMSPYAGTAIARRLAAEGRLEGTSACPDYHFRDPRLDLLQLFYSQTFNFRNFDDRGLVERLRFAKFDACVVEKYFADKYDAEGYRRSVRELIRMSNESALETMTIGVDFVAEHEAAEILQYWEILEDLTRQHKSLDQKMSEALDGLMTDNGFQVSLGQGRPAAKTWPPPPPGDAGLSYQRPVVS